MLDTSMGKAGSIVGRLCGSSARETRSKAIKTLAVSWAGWLAQNLPLRSERWAIVQPSGRANRIVHPCSHDRNKEPHTTNTHQCGWGKGFGRLEGKHAAWLRRQEQPAVTWGHRPTLQRAKNKLLSIETKPKDRILCLALVSHPAAQNGRSKLHLE
eukprot:6188632-Pleurochrysis_carterae.AAC.2